MKNHPVYDKIDELVRSRLGIPGAAGAVAKAMRELRPTKRVDPDDKVEAVAAEVCAIACREAGIVLPQPLVAGCLRELARAAAPRLKIVMAALAAIGERPEPGLRFHEAEGLLADEILTELPGRRFVRERPIAAEAVCPECETSTIRFSRRFADTGAWKDQVDDVHERILKRLELRGLKAQVRTGVWTRRGECHGEGHDQRGHGWFELPVILTRVDLGGGVAIEREYEIQ